MKKQKAGAEGGVAHKSNRLDPGWGLLLPPLPAAESFKGEQKRNPTAHWTFNSTHKKKCPLTN